VHELLQPEATFPRPTYLAADLASYSLDSVLMGLHTPSGSNGGHAGSNGGSSSRFDPSQPTLFTVEGLIYYLPEEAVKGLFAAMLKVAAPGSRVAFDFLHKEVGRHSDWLKGGGVQHTSLHPFWGGCEFVACPARLARPC
jgi:hypothetical protein